MTIEERWLWIEAIHSVLLETWNIEDFDNLQLWWKEVVNLDNQ